MPIDDEADRESRAKLTRHWAKARAKAKAGETLTPRTAHFDQRATRKQVAIRAQRAAGEALTALRRHQSGEGN